MVKHYIMVISNGQLNAIRGHIRDTPLLDVRGGWENAFGRECQRQQGGGPAWWAGIWKLRETGPVLSWELFDLEVIQAHGGLFHNDGGIQTQLATYVWEDDFPSLSLHDAFIAALADETRKNWALEPAPDDPEA